MNRSRNGNARSVIDQLEPRRLLSASASGGYAEASSLAPTDSAQDTAADDAAVLIRYTYYGDSTLDGSVDSLDYNALAANFGTTGQTWVQGDYNYDGTVDSNDFNALASNFGMTPGVYGGRVESLDFNALASPTTVTAHVTSRGTLIVHGTSRKDSLTIDNDFLAEHQIALSSVKRINIDAHGGNDLIAIDVDRPATVQGANGNDTITGGSRDDLLSGGKGDDIISGNGGDDHITGDRGRDLLNGDNGNDQLDGGAESDRLFGNRGDDMLIPGTGLHDKFNGGRGQDSALDDHGDRSVLDD